MLVAISICLAHVRVGLACAYGVDSELQIVRCRPGITDLVRPKSRNIAYLKIL